MSAAETPLGAESPQPSSVSPRAQETPPTAKDKLWAPKKDFSSNALSKEGHEREEVVDALKAAPVSMTGDELHELLRKGGWGNMDSDELIKEAGRADEAETSQTSSASSARRLF
mmetsp:Transcript_8502/g.19311  ORF Transcript_8502/g.19311 Transcript_8502/m.19311 type:complete len:114 (-) Transcript_8502:170-511(-)